MAIAGYKLKVNGGVYVDNIIDVGNVLTYDIPDLTHGVEYGVQVAAYDEEGVLSLYSATVYKTVLEPTFMLDGSGNVLIDGDDNAIIIFT